jgi:hypothetical protein
MLTKTDIKLQILFLNQTQLSHNSDRIIEEVFLYNSPTPPIGDRAEVYLKFLVCN